MVSSAIGWVARGWHPAFAVSFWVVYAAFAFAVCLCFVPNWFLSRSAFTLEVF